MPIFCDQLCVLVLARLPHTKLCTACAPVDVLPTLEVSADLGVVSELPPQLPLRFRHLRLHDAPPPLRLPLHDALSASAPASVQSTATTDQLDQIGTHPLPSNFKHLPTAPSTPHEFNIDWKKKQTLTRTAHALHVHLILHHGALRAVHQFSGTKAAKKKSSPGHEKPADAGLCLFLWEPDNCL